MRTNQATGHVDITSAAAASAALRTFFRIAEAWKLNIEEQMAILGCGRSTLYGWRERVQGGLDKGTLERLSHVFRIYSNLQLLLPVAERANAWVRRPNSAPLFGGRTALDRMVGGQVADLYVVRQYLDAQKGGWA